LPEGNDLQTQEVVHESGINLPELLARMAYDGELLQEILELFKQEFPKSRLSLLQALERGDLQQVQNDAHNLKGMLAGLSIIEGSSSAMRIERMAIQSAPEGIYEELTYLVNCVEVAQQNLERACRELNG
jgi:HPt (histidine-containing phosphotransfer) domain-containing protein